MKVKLPFILLLLSAITPGFAQKPVASLDFKVRFDNREYKSEFSPPKTLFGLKLVPEAGFAWGDGNRLMAGVELTRHFGAKGEDQPDPELILYYGYDAGTNFTAYAGVFRNDLIAAYPRAFISGATRFYDPLIEGALFRLSGSGGQIELSCDWHGMITDTKREKFIIMSAGLVEHAVKNNDLYAGYYFMMHHFAGTAAAETGVVDNVLAYPHIGAKVALDRAKTALLDVKAGWLQAYQNDRENESEFITPGGFMTEVDFKWHTFGINNTLYLGGGLMPYYDRYGAELYPGDSFFRTDRDVYNRFEASWQPRLKGGLSLKVSTVHHYDGRKWNWQQLATFSIRLNRETLKHP